MQERGAMARGGYMWHMEGRGGHMVLPTAGGMSESAES